MARLRPNHMALMKAVMSRRLPTSPNSRLANSTLPQMHSFWSAWSKVSDLDSRHDLRISSLGYLAWLSPWPCTPPDWILSPMDLVDCLHLLRGCLAANRRSTIEAEKCRIHLTSFGLKLTNYNRYVFVVWICTFTAQTGRPDMISHSRS